MKVLALKDQVGLVRRDDLVAFGAPLALLHREAVDAKRLLSIVCVDALTDELQRHTWETTKFVLKYDLIMSVEPDYAMNTTHNQPN